MTRATFTEAQVVRAMKAARRVDPDAIVEVTLVGTIRILPGTAAPHRAQSEVDAWFADDAG